MSGLVPGFMVPIDDDIRKQFGDELVGVQQCWDIPWCCIGNFSVVQYPSERLRCSSFSLVMRDFSNFIEDRS